VAIDKTFVVVKTVIGNCLLDSMSFSFGLPENAKGGDVTVFWTWINRIGNREYYMECADVTVNTNGDSTNINGKELLIVNLPGYPTVQEWELGADPSIDGRDLLEGRRDIISPTKTYNNRIRKPNPSFTKDIKQSQQSQQSQSENNNVKCNCITGNMKCNGSGFDTCVNNEWVYRECASGTSCKSNGDSIICDFV
jgi:hypothetical protein